MTRGQRLKALWSRIDAYVWNVLVMVIVAAASAGLVNWFNAHERVVLMDQFPVVRSEERAACTREFAAKMDGLTALNKQQGAASLDIKRQSEATLATLQALQIWLSRRATVNDQQAASMLKQSRAAAVAAATAAQKTDAVEQQVNVAVVKANDAANTAKAVDKKLETATRPALPAKPWIGNQR